MAHKLTKAEHDALCRYLADEGRLIEAGFERLRFTSIPADTPPVQVDQMRLAFYAGAQHLFASMTAFLARTEETTMQDLANITAIGDELDDFADQYEALHQFRPEPRTKGN